MNSAAEAPGIRNPPVCDTEPSASAESSRHGVAVADVGYVAPTDGSKAVRRHTQSHRFHWGETAAIVATAAGLALLVSQILPGAQSGHAGAAFRVLESRGAVFCESSDSNQWLPCDFDRSTSVVGLRTTEQASLSLETTIGARMVVGPASTLLMADANGSGDARRVTISEGTVDVSVPNLGSQLPFSILTPGVRMALQASEATVEVRKNGTRFSTCVRLRQGNAAIIDDGRELRVTAPAIWGCGASNLER
ncbi:MAG TPA: hypothetical protein VIV60_33555 [Polyangiaceae bacterium]